MRPSAIFSIVVCLLLMGNLFLFSWCHFRKQMEENHIGAIEAAVARLGLSDLCIATEARYTRHPAVSDPISPFMDYPAALEHFPTGIFWAPVSFISVPKDPS